MCGRVRAGRAPPVGPRPRPCRFGGPGRQRHVFRAINWHGAFRELPEFRIFNTAVLNVWPCAGRAGVGLGPCLLDDLLGFGSDAPTAAAAVRRRRLRVSDADSAASGTKPLDRAVRRLGSAPFGRRTGSGSERQGPCGCGPEQRRPVRAGCAAPQCELMIIDGMMMTTMMVNVMMGRMAGRTGHAAAAAMRLRRTGHCGGHAAAVHWPKASVTQPPQPQHGRSRSMAAAVAWP